MKGRWPSRIQLYDQRRPLTLPATPHPQAAPGYAKPAVGLPLELPMVRSEST